MTFQTGNMSTVNTDSSPPDKPRSLTSESAAGEILQFVVGRAIAQANLREVLNDKKVDANRERDFANVEFVEQDCDSGADICVAGIDVSIMQNIKSAIQNAQLVIQNAETVIQNVQSFAEDVETVRQKVETIVQTVESIFPKAENVKDLGEGSGQLMPDQIFDLDVAMSPIEGFVSVSNRGENECNSIRGQKSFEEINSETDSKQDSSDRIENGSFRTESVNYRAEANSPRREAVNNEGKQEVQFEDGEVREADCIVLPTVLLMYLTYIDLSITTYFATPFELSHNRACFMVNAALFLEAII